MADQTSFKIHERYLRYIYFVRKVLRGVAQRGNTFTLRNEDRLTRVKNMYAAKTSCEAHADLLEYRFTARDLVWLTAPLTAWPVGLGTGTDNRTGIFTCISPQNRYFAQYTGVHNVAVICSLSLLISMATVKSLTSTPGLEGSLLRCQGHIGRSNRQRLREGRKTR